MTTTINDFISDMATVEEADTYLDARGKTDWSSSTDDDAKSYALQRALDYIISVQYLDDAFDDGLPDKIKQAHIVAAYEEFKNPNCLQPNINRDDVLSSKQVAGVIQKTYSSLAPKTTQFTAIEALLRPYIKTQYNITISR